MNKKQVQSRVKAVTGRIKEATGKLIGNRAMQRKGLGERNAAERKALYEDLKADFKKLA